MNFYNRETELALLEAIRAKSENTAQMTFMVGRRRIGKTSLLRRANIDQPSLYFFLARKNESLLCEEFIAEIQEKLNIPVFGTIRSFKELFGLLMEHSKITPFTLVIDEFQEFTSINPAVFSEMQHIWDQNKETSKLNLILCGSMYAMMTRIFENVKEPLFGRATQRIHLKALNATVLKEILKDCNKDSTSEDLLALYLFTGGVPKYVELLMDAGAFTKEQMLHTIIAENSLFLTEGKNVLIDEFGKDYGNYFSILSLIASGKTSRVEMESILEMNTGGFLNRLETEFNLIRKIRPVLAKAGGRTIKYEIKDNFLRFWFRFVYKYRSAVEIGNLDYLNSIIKRDYDAYSGKILENYFREKLIKEKKYTEIGAYWEKGNENEIDIVAINEQDKSVLFVEVKRQAKNIKLEILKQKSEKLQQQFKGYSFIFKGLSMADM